MKNKLTAPYSIATLRYLNGMTQAELAEAIGITTSALSIIENIDNELLAKFAKVLGCKVEEIKLVG